MAKKTFYIIDGSSYIYRAYFAIRELSTSTGFPTNAVYGFTQMLLKIIKDKKPDYLAIAFDTKGPTFRHTAYQDYKIHRPEMPDPLALQIPYIHRMVEAFRIPVIMGDGFEADDLIGTLAKKGEAQGYRVVVVTGDKDMFQLISPGVSVYDTMKEKHYTEKEILEKFGTTPAQVVEIMGLMGDSVDNIPGVNGIGEKTAVQLVQQFGTIEHLLANLDQVKKPKLRQTLEAEAETARLSRSLALIDTDCPIEFDPARFQMQSPDFERLIPLCNEMEFSNILKGLTLPPPTMADGYRILLLTEAGKEIDAVQKKARVAVDMLLTSEEPMRAEWVGIAFCPEKGEAFYIPLEDRKQLPPEIKTILESASIIKVGHDLKLAEIVLGRRGIVLRNASFDTMIASYLLNPGRRDHTLETVAFEYLKERLTTATEAAGGDKEAKAHPLIEAQPSRIAPYLCQRADAILKLADLLPSLLDGQGLTPLFNDLEMPLVPVLAEIERNGVKIDADLLSEISKELDAKLVDLTERIYRLAGEEFNIGSPKQLAEILFVKLGLPPIRKTKTGYSTDEEVLTQLAVRHELPAEILNSRQLMKLRSTYVDALPKLIHPETGRVHTQLNQTIAATGRLSSKDPNLQNIPIKGELGRRIRQAFIAEPGHQLLSADYNQIELRLLAHMSEDPVLIESFRTGEDVHTRTAVQLFGLPKQEISSEMRRVAKTVNFGIIYGISPFGLASNLGVSQTEAKRYIDRYFENYQGVQRFIDQMLETATQQGYVTTLFGRRRHIAELSSRNTQTRGLGERLAVNTPLQGTAADIIKKAMIDIYRWMQEAEVKSRMILQVHDELIFEVPESEIPLMKEKVKEKMEGVIQLKAPLTVDIGVAANWAEAH
ncbi:MAG: DNA polymerase I [Candidatus Manganitrophus sp. SB1]|nr:DNA polymerase I [Candidatus Manganitrophus morganii]